MTEKIILMSGANPKCKICKHYLKNARSIAGKFMYCCDNCSATYIRDTTEKVKK